MHVVGAPDSKHCIEMLEPLHFTRLREIRQEQRQDYHGSHGIPQTEPFLNTKLLWMLAFYIYK